MMRNDIGPVEFIEQYFGIELMENNAKKYAKSKRSPHMLSKTLWIFRVRGISKDGI